jgi:hypothetical protein
MTQINAFGSFGDGILPLISGCVPELPTTSIYRILKHFSQELSCSTRARDPFSVRGDGPPSIQIAAWATGFFEGAFLGNEAEYSLPSPSVY